MATSTPHPFDTLTPGEVRLAVAILEKALPGVALRYKRIDVLEPIKNDVTAYLDAERAGLPLPMKPARLLFSYFHRRDNGRFCKAVLDVDARRPVYIKELSSDVQGPADVDELVEMEEACMKHPAVLAEIAKMQLPAGYTVCNDPWIYGTDSDTETRRLAQCYMYIVAVDHPQTNHYSLPCTFSPVFDQVTKELVRMDHLPTGADHSTQPTRPWKPVECVQYAQDLLDQPLRTDLKPYLVRQPQGPSFTVNGQSVYWQKWRFHAGFNNRDGLVLYNVTYDGRQTFYRLSMCEMTVPYGDPRRPYHRKQAFDAGDVGFGITANQLELGCDCLGHIHYFDGYRTDAKGNPVLLKNVICMHEQDNGLQFKHTNYRNQAATAVRKRELVLQMICTVSNYEYVLAWIFDQAGNIEHEVRATGILSTMPIDNLDAANPTTVPWGTNVGPGVMAAYHQHLFALRIDPAIDGHSNTLFYEESAPLPVDPETNNFGMGYQTQATVVQKAGFADLDVTRNRVFKIRNDSHINRVSRKPVAYKIHAAPSQMLLMAPGSFARKRAAFAEHAMWVTKYQDDELYAAGEFTNQSRRDTGLSEWAARPDNVENTDIVVWHTFGLTHNPRPEDFPVMPAEHISVRLQPDGFFEKNPALDVPQSNQAFNQSTLHQETAEATCCSSDRSWL
ncbi:hypothetical protein HMPREF1624_07707 [Sporothrix schenckii ATCC 58251]|uniref:Amine oxidase n=1 Tax=Sporothrix schenckii (strain ATCC 58251 / de Perez 2211183) TaxID=1391915 RepID=U7PMK9_SPOS1|nr:hypothetical protein HMPREF1624_07707 [Sporothrix schenckii ATCC 58251]